MDGNSCVCNNYDTAYCIASCSTNISNHEVRYEYGKGVITVTCSQGNFALGCNIMPHHDHPKMFTGKCLAWAVKSANSCECYDDDEYGATCYAICGQYI